MTADRRDINRMVYRATDARGIGMLDPRDRWGRKNAYIDCLQKEAIARVCAFTGEETVLEYGCGAGRIAGWLGERTRQVVAVDIDPDLLRIARHLFARDNVLYMEVGASETPFADGSFDIITCIGLFRFMSLDEVGVLLGRFRRLLKPGGTLVCIDRFFTKPRPAHHLVAELHSAFEKQDMGSVRALPIRKGHWLPLYLVQFGLIPRSRRRPLAHYELDKRARDPVSPRDYYQYIWYYTREGERG